MNNEEAKFTLHAYRPSGRDAADATFAPALEQAQRDPKLGAWFAREQAHASAVSAKLASVAPPAGLRDAILAGARASGPGARAARRRAPIWLMAAAGIAAGLIAAFAWWPSSPPAVDRLVPFALNDTAHAQHGGHGALTGALQASLSQPKMHLGAGLPIDFGGLKATGCRTLRVEGHDVLEVCFGRDGAEFHCYIARRDDFPSEATAIAPEVEQRAGFAAASWTDAAYRFVVVSHAGIAAVKRLL